MSTSKTTIALSVLALAGISYAVYFDYKRRNDQSFRRKLRKEKKKVDKTVAQTKERDSSTVAAASGVSTETLKEALQKIREEDSPTTTDEREQYFMSQVGIGEQLATQGPAYHLPAALSFFRALRVYPAPVELIMIYQKTVPPQIFAIVMELTNLDAKSRAEGYFDHFPPASMNVAVESRKVVDVKGNFMERKCLVAKKNFAAGDLIYTEQPVVATLDADLEGQGIYCSCCLRTIEKGMAISSEATAYPSVFCSKDCQLKAKSQYETLLFSLDPVLPSALASQTPEPDKETRKVSQAEYVAYLKKATKIAPLLVAKLLGLQVEVEMSKLMSASKREPSSEIGSEDYSIYDHLERLRYLEVVPPEEEPQLLSKVLEHAMPGLEQFITDERYAVMLGKMMYNSFGVCFGGGRDDRPPSIHRPEESERTRTSYGTARQHGSGFYRVSSYLAHNCAPSARASFRSGTSELHLLASNDIKEGDELTVAYVDVAQHEDEALIDARRRRRVELARGWRFACTCQRCINEAKELEAQSTEQTDDDGVGQIEDGSKIEKAVESFEQRQKGGLI